MMNPLPFKGMRRDEEKVRWTFSPPNGCDAFLHPGGHTRRGWCFFRADKQPIPLASLSPLKGEKKKGFFKFSRLRRLTVLLTPLRRSPNKPPAFPGVS